MKTIKLLLLTAVICVSGFVLASFLTATKLPVKSYKFPYKKGGLTERQAAAQLLNRFTYGATPGQVDQVVNMGLEKWFEQQLNADAPDDSLNKRLASYDAINLSNSEVLQKFPPGFVVVHMAIIDSAISKDSVDKAVDKKAYNDKIQAYMKSKGLRSDQELYKQFISQNILRAAYTNNQLQEVMSDFWFNHFNVSFTKGECAQFIPAYERDVIRPNALGEFDKLLLASAKSPAMLYFLDNLVSQGAPAPPANNMMMGGDKAKAKPTQSAASTDMAMGAAPAKTNAGMDMMMMSAAAPTPPKPKPNAPKNVTGLNENYAREVMELHTLGVDGGYTQTDVTQAARVLTGWTMYPLSSYGYGSNMKGLVDKVGVNNLEAKGYVHDGDFLFTPTRHDMGEKVVLGHTFPAKGGYQEGVDLLEMLAHHPSTAKFISKKLAVRFVSDNPPQSLIDKMAKTFTEQNGDIKQVLITMVSSPEFWSKKVQREKIKSPFELVVSSVRALNADIQQPYQLFNWMSRMGEKIYYYQAPTGFPDRGQYWINTGALLNRMNFGLALTSGRIPGVTVNLAALNNHHEPESPEAALITYSKLVMPERDLDKTIKQLSPLLTVPDVANKVNDAVTKTPIATSTPPPATFSGMDAVPGSEELTKKKDAVPPPKVMASAQNTKNNANMLAQVVGIIIGSPEYQRR
ncbi:hypothetical protein BEL04_02870 [Mucilaginibacter sp. PPCGB 2223]|uniref:DUF1800 domain-containing protein n=1 Tax=Mucilaginibacter sp. PPCGB 2223 TaxID=1886027 RepID=UPI0008270E5D|nr:DUF1800 domain-containing protein [Mucilaginibacter sp. PPCGB 2223]OCX53264.1 hypothetical protein BEL04_02870 [Mucilaginibacter sp. PPCGB 2223]